MLIVFFPGFFLPAEWIAACSHLHTALQVAAVLVLPGILCPSGCWQGGKGSMCMVISAVYNDRQLRGGASGRMSTLQHASSVFFQTLYRCTMYTCIFIINIYIFNSYYIYTHIFWLANPINQNPSFIGDSTASGVNGSGGPGSRGWGCCLWLCLELGCLQIPWLMLFTK